ncbi:MAG: hypothetical protein QM489_02055 [Candidatus Izemoplasma sp.]
MEKNNFDKLVKVVTDNILEKIELKTSFEINDKTCLILIPNIGIGLKDNFEYVMKNYPDNNFIIGSSEEFSKMTYIENNKNLRLVKFDIKNSSFINLLDEVENIIILGLKMNQLKSLSEANDSEDINHIILSSIMANKSLDVIININEILFNKILDVVQGVRKIGISVTNIKQSNGKLLENEYLITESFVNNLGRNGLSVLLIDKKQLVTPLAKDKLRELKISIEYNKED